MGLKEKIIYLIIGIVIAIIVIGGVYLLIR